MARVLVCEPISERGIEMLREAGHEVRAFEVLSPEELKREIAEAEAVIIRSGTTVDSDVIAAATKLVVIGRAGIGLDNVDIEAATARGILVVNAPQSNVVSAAEHTLALMLALARNLPQAHSSLVSGKWERSRFEGVELHSKTLGIVGLGRVGTLVAQRASAFGMRIIAYDPYVSRERASNLGIELVSLEDLFSRSDFVSVHLPKTPETAGMIDMRLLKLAKPSLRIVNTARGGIVKEADLLEALKAGVIAGAALDVFEKEPCTSSPLFELPNVVVTPHLGASTKEAQDKAGTTIAEQVVAALNGDLVPYAVNLPLKEAAPEVRQFVGLAEQLGSLMAGLEGALPEVLEVECQGELAAHDTTILGLAALKGLFRASLEEPVSYVNVMQVAQERGLVLKQTKTTSSRDYVNLITLRSRNHSIGGTLVGVSAAPRIVMLDDHVVEAPPGRYMLVVRNDDRPGMIGIVGTVLGNHGISISSMAVGPSKHGNTALMVLTTDKPVTQEVLEELRGHSGILSVHTMSSLSG
jgi:D-3-phosphoglycerate dehydrogenase